METAYTAGLFKAEMPLQLYVSRCSRVLNYMEIVSIRFVSLGINTLLRGMWEERGNKVSGCVKALKPTVGAFQLSATASTDHDHEYHLRS